MLRVLRQNKKVIEALEIAKLDHSESFDKAIEFIDFAKIMDKLGLQVYPLPERFKKKVLDEK